MFCVFCLRPLSFFNKTQINIKTSLIPINFNNNLIDITGVNFVQREKASYDEPIVRIDFKTEEEFLFWKANVADKHATWICNQNNKSTKEKAS